MLQVRTVPLRLDIRQTPRIPHADTHRPEALPVRTVRPILQTEAIAEETHQSLPQSLVRAAAPAREDARVSRVSQGVPTQREPHQAHGHPRSRFQYTGETVGAEVGSTEEDTDHRRATGRGDARYGFG